MQTKQNRLTVGVLALGLSLALPAFGGEGKKPGKVPNALYEMVPHVVLPESVQYTPSAKSLTHLASRSLNSSPSGVSSPFVATYTAFPSYQLPYGTPMKTVRQTVYPVSPKLAPQRLPEAKTDDVADVSDELTQTEPKALNAAKETTPILLASNTEEVVPATPTADTSTEITQTGIFCSTPTPKTPASWSFSSPLFKVASVPMGNNGFINQMGMHGNGAQVGFNAMGACGMPGMTNGPMMGGVPGGPQFFTLPNGFSMMAMPPSHAGCGLLRCRHTGPQWMILPPGPMGTNSPTLAPPADPAALMMMQMQQMQAMQQPQPVTAMTPYGMVVVGYRPAPMAAPAAMNPMMNPMMGAPMNPYAMQIQQLQQQIHLLQQQNALLVQGQFPKQASDGENKDGLAPSDPQVPLPFNPQANLMQQLQPMSMFGGYVPYVPYSQMYAADANQKPALGDLDAVGLNSMAAGNPMMMENPMMMGMNPMMFGGNPYMACGMNSGMGAFNQGGMSMSDMLMLMMLMKDNQPRRQGLFARFAARRAEARERRNAAQQDVFQQMMQMWATPYMPADTAMQMPARNAYPFGYFGAQVGPQNTANYGGFYNLYMGNTSYPGLY